jgi:hypothetical protein
MENRLAHLQMLQAIIARMASNSFFLKGWSVTLTSGLFALASNKSNGVSVNVAFLPVLMFWALDGYFLRQERLFRRLYDAVRARAIDNIDFSMDITPVSGQVSGWAGVCLSSTLLLFHGVLFLTVLLTSMLAWHLV